MLLNGKFVAMLIGENSELRTRKSDGVVYAYNTVAVMQNGMVANLRVDDKLFQALKDMEHFKQYEMCHVYNTDYSSFMVTDMRLWK